MADEKVLHTSSDLEEIYRAQGGSYRLRQVLSLPGEIREYQHDVLIKKRVAIKLEELEAQNGMARPN